jgi:two-component system, LytTR family, response regulator
VRELRAIIVDDEPLAREGMRLLCGGDPELRVVAEAGNVDGAVEAIRRLRPDLVFLDVEMPGGGAFVALRELGPATPLFVFVTAYERYALRAFDVQALDYLLKPVSEARFREAVARAKTARRVSPRRLEIREVGRVRWVEIDDIDWIEAADYCVELHLGAETALHRTSLKELEAELDGRFVRIHRRAMVNRDRIREVRRRGNAVWVVLSDGRVLPVSRSARGRL